MEYAMHYLVLTLSSLIVKVASKKGRCSLPTFILGFKGERCNIGSIKINITETFKSLIENIDHIKF